MRSWGQEFLGEGFFGTVTSWVIGLVLGIVLALFSYFFYYGAIVLLGGDRRVHPGRRPARRASASTGSCRSCVGLVVGVLFAIAVLVLAVPIVLVIVLSAFSGAAAVVNGVLDPARDRSSSTTSTAA